MTTKTKGQVIGWQWSASVSEID